MSKQVDIQVLNPLVRCSDKRNGHWFYLQMPSDNSEARITCHHPQIKGSYAFYFLRNKWTRKVYFNTFQWGGQILNVSIVPAPQNINRYWVYFQWQQMAGNGTLTAKNDYPSINNSFDSSSRDNTWRIDVVTRDLN